jgi:hypothetical protein
VGEKRGVRISRYGEICGGEGAGEIKDVIRDEKAWRKMIYW